MAASTDSRQQGSPEALTAIRATFAEFHEQNSVWQREVGDLFDDLSAAVGALSVSSSARIPESEILAELLTIGRTLHEDNDGFRERQARLGDEVAILREMVEQQVKLFSSRGALPDVEHQHSRAPRCDDSAPGEPVERVQNDKSAKPARKQAPGKRD
jgi:hypothetical protein